MCGHCSQPFPPFPPPPQHAFGRGGWRSIAEQAWPGWQQMGDAISRLGWAGMKGFQQPSFSQLCFSFYHCGNIVLGRTHLLGAEPHTDPFPLQLAALERMTLPKLSVPLICDGRMGLGLCSPSNSSFASVASSQVSLEQEFSTKGMRTSGGTWDGPGGTRHFSCHHAAATSATVAPPARSPIGCGGHLSQTRRSSTGCRGTPSSLTGHQG